VATLATATARRKQPRPDPAALLAWYDRHRRVLPCSALAHRVAHFWWVRWNLKEPFVAMTLPHPTVHVIFEPPARAVVHGVPERRFERRLEGRGFGDVPMSLEYKLEVWDSPNSAGTMIDAIRSAKVARDLGQAGPVEAASAYFMKSPPVQKADHIAREELEAFLQQV